MGRGCAGPGAEPASAAGGGAGRSSVSGRTVMRGAHAASRPSVQTRGSARKPGRREGFTSAQECSLQSRISAEYSDPVPHMAREKDNIALSDEHNSRGIELADRGWLDEAIREFRKAIDLDPDSAHAHDNLATVYAEKKLYREDLAEYLTALKLELDSATAHYNLACFLSTHGPEFAVAEYKQAIELDPEYPDSHLNLGLTYAD